jgi:hypothetical protein
MPIGVTGVFFGLPVATLTTMQTNYIAVMTGIATAGQSYTLSGRAFTRANLPEVRQTLVEIQRALDRANGVSNSFTFANMNTGGSPSSAQTSPTM